MLFKVVFDYTSQSIVLLECRILYMVVFIQGMNEQYVISHRGLHD